MRGNIPRPCWNKCGTQIEHRMDGGTYAWVETANGQRHKCPNQPGKKKAAAPLKLEADPWSTRRGRAGLRMGLSIGQLKRGLRVVGEHYRPFVHQVGCSAAPWQECACR